MQNKGKVLFLSNNNNTVEAYEYLKSVEKEVVQMEKAIALNMVKEIKPDYIVSYNYNHIIVQEVIEYMNGNIINLHASYLPWNRGSYPNFWSFIKDTPKGVSIHYINKELDKGAIILHKKFEFDEQIETFLSTYDFLNHQITNLFCSNWELLRENKLEAHIPEGSGSYQSNKDFLGIYNKCPFSWDEKISDVKKKILRAREG